MQRSERSLSGSRQPQARRRAATARRATAPGAHRAVVLAGLLACWNAGVCAADWQPDAAQRARLAARETIVLASVDPSGASGRARAAIWIDAPAGAIYERMIDCTQALTYVPKLKFCKVLDAAADGRSQTIAHEMTYSWLLPRLRYVFRARYQPVSSIDIEQLSGDLEIHEARWRLEPGPGGAGTIVIYEVRVKPRMYVPQWLVRRSLRKDLPELLLALRGASERPGN